MKTVFKLILLLTVLLMPSACSSGSSSDMEKALERADGTANQDSVVKLLQRTRLLVVPEVKQMSDYYIERYRTQQMTREQAAKEFRLWLEDWIQKNPKIVENIAKGRAADSTTVTLEL